MSPAAAPIQTLSGKTVLFRADLSDGVTDEIARPIAAFARAGARVAVVSGFGDPAGDINPALSLRRFAEPLEQATGVRTTFVSDSVGAVAEAGLDRVPFGEVALLENVRFHPEAHRFSRNFAVRLSVLGDFFAIGGSLPPVPAGWIRELAAILPAPTLAQSDPNTTSNKDR
ncbi:MAG: phosphoglycerate kinase [Rhizobiaceae bacterium]